MKLTVFVIVLCSLSVSAKVYSQDITASYRGESLKAVLADLSKQSNYDFVFDEQYIHLAKPITMTVRNVHIDQVLKQLFASQPFTYAIENGIIYIKPFERISKLSDSPPLQQTIRGRVTDSLGTPLQGVSIQVLESPLQTTTDRNGHYELAGVPTGKIIRFRLLSYEPYETPADRTTINVTLKYVHSRLDESLVIAYGTTTQRLNTGSVSRVTAEEISKQPASNILGALSGRVPGLEVTQSTGTPGSSFNIRIRGLNSVAQGSEPLILIDGIPFASQNENINNFASSIGNQITGGGLSPFYSINPADIESIEVLKDADATAIYGSRGANGVILISTKKERTVGETRISANISQGFNTIPKGMPLMNTDQYLEMRREAFQNSGIEPTINNAPDLLAWDANRYTDLRKELLGNTGYVTNAQLSLSGGNNNTQFLLAGGYFKETNVLPDNFPNQRGSLNLNLNHKSSDGKLQINFSGSYTSSSNQASGTDLTVYTFLPPNIPSFRDDGGNLKWEEHGTNYDNPNSYQLQRYRANTGNLMSSVNLQYSIFKNLSIKLLAGYNELNNKDINLFPRASYSPAIEINSSSQFGNAQYKSWNFEPQIEYDSQQWIGKLNVLVGGTFQDNQQSRNSMILTGFSSDALLESAQAASSVSSRSTFYSQYRYQALFGRINYNIADRYLINLTARRDGSSRFGPAQKYANFGAIGAAWIFSSEKFIETHIPILSYGKFRGSFGVTGNDQIGDYQYLDAWGATAALSYQNTSSLNPLNLFNPMYGWEKNKKLEGAVELGFWDDRVLLIANHYRNRSSNQLVQYRLPSTTGFASIISNFPALVENKGWELLLNTQLILTKDFQWNNSINISLPKNTLLEYPNIESSSYNYTYVVGHPLNLIYNYQSIGVNPETGVFRYNDLDDNGAFNFLDYVINGQTDARFYGGLRNTFNYKGIGLDLFFDFRKQQGRNFLYSVYSSSTIGQPGTMWNQPASLLERWQNEGDIVEYERFNSSNITGRPNPSLSNVGYSDQSFIRLRSLQFSYNLPPSILSSIKAKNINTYIQGQNLFTWNKDKGYDPEVQNLYRMAPFQTYTFGIQLTY